MHQNLSSQIANAIRTRSLLPRFPNSLSVADAYEIQHQVTTNLGVDSIVGIKAGLTSKGSQESFGIAHPVLGRIFDSGRIFPRSSFETTSGGFLECEIGVCIDALGNPISVCPVIELPRFAFKVPSDALGSNLIACNVAADRYVIGDCLEIPKSFVAQSVTLCRDGEKLYSANLNEPLGGPMNSFAWMLAEANVREISIPSEALMLTGACGGIHPALPGNYVADYGSLGNIEFQIRAGENVEEVP